MNSRQTILKELQQYMPADKGEWMNFLQDFGLVSDNAVESSDVPDCDLIIALRRLKVSGSKECRT
jgi:hypothetical protein